MSVRFIIGFFFSNLDRRSHLMVINILVSHKDPLKMYSPHRSVAVWRALGSAASTVFRPGLHWLLISPIHRSSENVRIANDLKLSLRPSAASLGTYWGGYCYVELGGLFYQNKTIISHTNHTDPHSQSAVCYRSAGINNTTRQIVPQPRLTTTQSLLGVLAEMFNCWNVAPQLG